MVSCDCKKDTSMYYWIGRVKAGGEKTHLGDRIPLLRHMGKKIYSIVRHILLHMECQMTCLLQGNMSEEKRDFAAKLAAREPSQAP